MPHLQAEEEGETGEVHVSLTVELSCGVVGFGTDVLYSSSVAGSLALAHDFNHPLNCIDEEYRDESADNEIKV